MGPMDSRWEQGLNWRSEVRPDDQQQVRRLCQGSGMFSPQEVEVAVELVQASLQRGAASEYHFIFAERAGHTLGYACYGPIACTLASWDLYWIVVEPLLKGQGLGRQLLQRVEQHILEAGGERLYVETSAREQYQPTRDFYRARGYSLAACLEDYYGAGDGMAIYLKILNGGYDAACLGGALPRDAKLAGPI